MTAYLHERDAPGQLWKDQKKDQTQKQKQKKDGAGAAKKADAATKSVTAESSAPGSAGGARTACASAHAVFLHGYADIDVLAGRGGFGLGWRF